MQVLIPRTDRLPVIPTLLPRTRLHGAQVLTNLPVMFCSGPSCTSFDYPLVQALVGGPLLTPHPHQTCFSPHSSSF